MPGTVQAAMEVALLGRAGFVRATGRGVDRAGAGRERREERVETLHDVGLAADHETVAPLDAPYAAACPAVDVVKASLGKLLRALDVVSVVGIPAVDDDVARPEARDKML